MGTVLNSGELHRDYRRASGDLRAFGRLLLIAAVSEDFGNRPKIQPKRKPQAEIKAGRNDPCPCGSGKKFKKCHHPAALQLAEQTRQEARAAEIAAAQRLEAAS